MPIRWVEKTSSLSGVFVDASITYPAPRESSGLTQALTNADPGTASATFAVTLAATDFPTVPLSGNEWTVFVHLNGQNTSGATATMQHAAGHVISSTDTVLHTLDGNTVTTTQYFNYMLYVWQGPYKVGDKIYVRLWSNQASGMTLKFTHLQVMPTRIRVTPPKYVLADVTLDYVPKPTFTASATNWNSSGMVFPGFDLGSVWYNNNTLASGSRGFSYMPNKDQSVGATQAYYGDNVKDMSYSSQPSSPPLTTIQSFPTRIRGRLMPSF